ncbi:NADH-quinone oxidoreductase subunit NuoE [secondary endosymbiont of Ctenarytaina eucalypti]|uniref:NADH-quinone oxidoreductase subunit E n=1 Tax=secondary endosymbiont of Ctenarytaina eucalypti TaxID=1199245 RepID=J3TXN0_9ENTR|nr:NADH-quinone oxidoreductase subunit NuoE [secondary endosymbiont of Ctenarytaina eucalypti]AFP84980.1 NADH-quinone oxidoreductase, E subunit [secondary endosymbiont of Ctenarytaina eucalypti]
MQKQTETLQHAGGGVDTKTEIFELSHEEGIAIGHERLHYEDARAVSIEALKIVQKHRGWVPDGAITAIAQCLGISGSDVEGVATFYSQIFRQPVGRHVVRYCDSVVCYITGYQGIQGALEQALNITLGQTTPDNRFTLLPTCCLGHCDKGPIMMVNEDTYLDLTPDAIVLLLEKYQ